jgi:hypothetical protein
VPGTPLPRLRPEQASPVSQVPLLPVPQQDCPSAPQAWQRLPPEATTHSCGAVQAGAAPSTAAPPVVQQTWSDPPHGPHVPAVLWVVSRPEHANPELQVPVPPVPQHDCPEAPQADVHTLPEDLTTQEVPVPLHGVPPPQHA